MRDVVSIWLFSKFLFHLFSFACWRIKVLLSFFFLLIAVLIFLLSVMTNNQTKCGIIYEKNAMRAGDDEWMINYKSPYIVKNSKLFLYPCRQINNSWAQELVHIILFGLFQDKNVFISASLIELILWA